MLETIQIKSNAFKRLSTGHLWVYSNELNEIPKLKPGTIVEAVLNKSNVKSYGLAFYNPHSLISLPWRSQAIWSCPKFVQSGSHPS